MTRQDIINTAISVVEDMRGEYVPTDTGNMAYNALQYRVDGDQFIVWIDCDKVGGIAPYAPYTNEPWLSPKWNGKQNPNEGWWQRFVEEFTRRLALKLRGEVV